MEIDTSNIISGGRRTRGKKQTFKAEDFEGGSDDDEGVPAELEEDEENE